MVQRGVVGVGVDAQTQAGHAADRVVQRPALFRQRAQVVRVGRHDGEHDAGIGAASREACVVHRCVAVVDAIDLQQLDSGAHVGPRHAELAGMCGRLQAGTPRFGIGVGKQFGRSVNLAIVDADADHLVDIGQQLREANQRITRRVFQGEVQNAAVVAFAPRARRRGGRGDGDGGLFAGELD